MTMPPAPTPRSARIWTSQRITLTLVVFALLSVALSSSCNNEANYEASNNAPATTATPTRPTRRHNQRPARCPPVCNRPR